jgi:hypothetical protein
VGLQIPEDDEPHEGDAHAGNQVTDVAGDEGDAAAAELSGSIVDGGVCKKPSQGEAASSPGEKNDVALMGQIFDVSLFDNLDKLDEKINTNFSGSEMLNNMNAAGVPPSGREQALSSAAKDGFKLQESVGGFWYRALKESPTLKQDYAKIGRSYEQQRAFRQRWAEKEAADLKYCRVQSQTISEIDESVGL